MLMKSKHRSLVFLVFFAILPLKMAGFSIATLPYPFNTWHANAKTYVQQQEEIQSYHLTVKIKQRTKTIKEQSFTAFDYKKVIAKAVHYAQKEQAIGLKVIFKPSIRLVKSWDMYPLGNVVATSLPASPAEQSAYWQQVEKTITNSFYVTPPAQQPAIAAIKKLLSLGYIPLTLLTCLIIFLLGLVSLHFVSRKRL